MDIDKNVITLLDVRSTTIVMYCWKWFLHEPDRCKILLAILERRAGFSLRLTDYFTTSYCKSHSLFVSVDNANVSLSSDYERHLSVYNKKAFDAFARRAKIEITLCGKTINTTVGQLNFFRWFISRGLHILIIDLQEQIEREMKSRTSHRITDNVSIAKGAFEIKF